MHLATLHIREVTTRWRSILPVCFSAVVFCSLRRRQWVISVTQDPRNTKSDDVPHHGGQLSVTFISSVCAREWKQKSGFRLYDSPDQMQAWSSIVVYALQWQKEEGVDPVSFSVSPPSYCFVYFTFIECPFKIARGSATYLVWRHQDHLDQLL